MSASPDPESGKGRIAAAIEYNGRPFFGWQRQQDAATPGVQSAVESALSTVADHPVEVFCAGRTDTGVHATHQVIHFDTHSRRSTRQWLMGCNANLPDGVRMRWAKEQSASFHARFSALSRRYIYCIDNRPVKPGVFAGLHSWQRLPLNEELMAKEAQALLGEHDFSSFRAAGCQAKTAIRTIKHIELVRREHMLTIDISANAFLQHMVRNIAGVLMAVGSGAEPPGWTAEVLAAEDRTKGGVTAPPNGLYLVGVEYPEEFDLPSQSAIAGIA